MSIKEIDQGCFEVGEEEGCFPCKVSNLVIGCKKDMLVILELFINISFLKDICDTALE